MTGCLCHSYGWLFCTLQSLGMVSQKFSFISHCDGILRTSPVSRRIIIHDYLLSPSNEPSQSSHMSQDRIKLPFFRRMAVQYFRSKPSLYLTPYSLVATLLQNGLPPSSGYKSLQNLTSETKSFT